MSEIVWDQVGDRYFETGLDRGVLYLPDGSAVPWNGLISVNENSDQDSSPVYYDGRKINNLVSPGDFKGALRALTYPDEFVEVEGSVAARPGVILTSQQPKTFDLSYRTRISNDLSEEHYKIHLLYNVTAVPTARSYTTLSADLNAMEFEWEINAIPEDVPEGLPTSHIILDSRDIDPATFSALENMLYGDSDNDPTFPSVEDILDYVDTFVQWVITDNGDGTWTAETDGDIPITDDGMFTLHGVDANYTNAFTYELLNVVV